MPSIVQGATSLTMSVYSPQGELLILDASGDLAGGDITYEDTPSGCGSCQLTVGLTYEQVDNVGYYSARNIIEISSADDCLQVACNNGATKLYILSTLGYDTAAGHDDGQVALWDGDILTMCIPVTGVGSDAGGNYITLGPPLNGYGNPSSVPAYGVGTLVYRRRYAGIIMGRNLISSRDPTTIVRCTGLSQRMTETVCTFALTNNTVDMGTAILNLLSDFQTNWPELIIMPGNFFGTGQTNFNGSYDRTMMANVISDLLAAAGSTGDSWTVRIGHDRTPRLVHLFSQSDVAYGYNITVNQGVTYFEARTFTNNDQDASGLYNVIEVIGDTNPVTNQPATAIVEDTTSIGLYGEIDAQPVTNTACKTSEQCAVYGQALLNQKATPRSNAEVLVSTRNDVYVAGAPMGLSRGDVILGVHCVTVPGISTTPGVPAPPAVYGLVSSVVTTITPGGDTHQDARFSAIIPDWTENLQERANALASALRQNTTTAVAFSQYFVSIDAFGYTISGLTVTTPQFVALFAAQTVPLDVGGSSFTLAANTTNWVWITTSGAWIVQSVPTTQPGAILYAIFTTDSSNVIGSINKAAMGILPLSLGSLPSMGDQTAPVLTNISDVTYPVIGNATYDAEVSFTVDVLAAPWLVGVAIFSVDAGSVVNPEYFPMGSVSSYGLTTGTYTAVWKGIGAGNSEDLYVAYEDEQGRYSPTTLVGTTVANPTGTTSFGPVGQMPPGLVGAASAFVYFATGASTYETECVIFLDPLGTTANNNLAEVETVSAPHSKALGPSSAGWTPSGAMLDKNTSGIYNICAGALGAGTQYDIGIRYVGHTGDRSWVYVIGTTNENQQNIQNLPGMPATQGAPNITSNWVLTYPVVGNATYDAALTYTADVVGAAWLIGLALFATPVGSAMPKNPMGFTPANASGVYTSTWQGLGAGQSYLLGIAYEDGQGVLSPVEIGTLVTNANPAGTTAFAPIGTAAPAQRQAASAFAYAVGGGGTYDANFTVYLDPLGTTANNALSEIEVVVVPAAQNPSTTSTNWVPVGAPLAVNSAGTYPCTAGGMGVQIPYVVGVRYVGHTGARSYVYIVGTTTASQLAQIPFTNVQVDPATGYIAINDTLPHPTGLQYALPVADVGSMLAASWSAYVGAPTGSVEVWLMYQSNGAGYYFQWFGSNVAILKWTNSSTYTVLAIVAFAPIVSGVFINYEFVASMTTAGSVNLTGIINGRKMISCIDSSSPFTSGYIAANFRANTGTCYIDEKTIKINLGGSPSSSAIKAQGNLVPSSLPYGGAVISSPTDSGSPYPPNQRQAYTDANTLIFADGSTLDWPATGFTDYGGADGDWYFSMGLVLSTKTQITYLSQTPPTAAQLAAFYQDGVVALFFNQVFTVPAGSYGVADNWLAFSGGL